MDYRANKGLSRKSIRFIAYIIRQEYNIKTIKLPVLKLLEWTVSRHSSNLFYEVNEDEYFEEGVQAYCEPINGNYEDCCIHIRESVYNKALKDDGSALGIITHELCHYYLIFILGIKPDFRYNYQSKDEEIKPYLSIEWQAKALCGELMIPYEKCKNKTLNQIMYITKSSKMQTENFLKRVRKGNN